MLAFFLKKHIFAAIFRLLPATIPATLSDAALLFGIQSFVKLINGDSVFTVPEWFLCMVLLALLRFYFLRLRGSIAEHTFRRFGAKLQMRFFRTLSRLNPRFFHSLDSEARLRSVFESTETLPKSGESLVQALQAVVQLAVFFPVLLYLSWQLTLMLFCVVLPVVGYSQKRLHQMGKAEEETLAREGSLRSDLECARDMKRFWSSKGEKRVVLKNVFLDIRELLNAGVRLAVRKLTLSLLIETVSVIAMVVVLALCAYMISRGLMTPGDLVLYSSAVFLCYKPIKECTRAMPQLRSAATAYKVLQFFENETMGYSNKKGISSNLNSLQVIDGNFGYGNVEVFSGFNFTAAFENSMPVFLHGPNGAGKSTLLKLIAGLEVIDSGSIKLPNGFDSVYFLSQGVFLPPVNILRNELKLKKGLLENAAVQKFIEVSKVMPLLKKEKYSGGESARIGLFWALVSDATLLLLDEPMAFISRFDKDAILGSFLDACQVLGKRVILSGHEELPESLSSRFEFKAL